MVRRKCAHAVAPQHVGRSEQHRIPDAALRDDTAHVVDVFGVGDHAEQRFGPAEPSMERVQGGSLVTADAAPRRPEVQQYRFSAQVLQPHHVAVQRFQRERWRRSVRRQIPRLPRAAGREDAEDHPPPRAARADGESGHPAWLRREDSAVCDEPPCILAFQSTGRALRGALGRELCVNELWRAAILVATCLVACVEQPHTRAELVSFAREGRADSETKEKVVDRDFELVLQKIDAQNRTCLNRSITHPGGPGSPFPWTEQYIPELMRTADDRAEWALQISVNDGAIGGYGMAADVTRDAPGRTRVVLYYGSVKFGEIADAMLLWIEGRDAPCPLD